MKDKLDRTHEQILKAWRLQGSPPYRGIRRGDLVSLKGWFHPATYLYTLSGSVCLQVETGSLHEIPEEYHARCRFHPLTKSGVLHVDESILVGKVR